MSKAIKDLEKQKRREEMVQMAKQLAYAPKPPTPTVSPLRPPKGSSNPIGVEKMREIDILKHEVADAIRDEKNAEAMYMRMATRLSKIGFKSEADTVARISASEVGHQTELERILKRLKY